MFGVPWCQKTTSPSSGPPSPPVSYTWSLRPSPSRRSLSLTLTPPPLRHAERIRLTTLPTVYDSGPADHSARRGNPQVRLPVSKSESAFGPEQTTGTDVRVTRVEEEL
ncbi:hypothetical protein GCM10010298_38070 [Streptomyces microflavus]|uniref:Uncharacterized protein n=1 Tax=Streptomyces microflavus TaxID=1919 RepID=A0A7J0D005_STRMI|nr:hypothetical protein Smic_65640 [Streptomyces microflavus]GGX69823.1 hypothetical protein GCM10010298_38070 [Streptomyces microflavus]